MGKTGFKTNKATLRVTNKHRDLHQYGQYLHQYIPTSVMYKTPCSSDVRNKINNYDKMFMKNSCYSKLFTDLLSCSKLYFTVLH